MSNLKKAIVSIIIALLVIIGYSSVSKAVSYSVGQRVELGYGDYKNRSDLYCIEHTDSLHSDKITYKVVSKVKLIGFIARDHKDKEVEHRANAKLSYILASNGSKAEKQRAIWKFMNTWMNNVGYKMAGLHKGFSNNENEGKEEINQEAIDYANSLKQELKMTNNTDRDEITVETQGNFLKVGPFNWSFSGTMSEIIVFDQNNNQIDGIKIGKYKGGEFVKISLNEMKTDKNFYVLIPKESGATRLTKIKVRSQVNVMTSTIYFLEAEYGSWQNLISIDTGSKPQEVKDEMELDIELLGQLNIIKVNSNNTQIVLNNIGFKFKNTDINQYICRDANGNISYTSDINRATEFITGKDGQERNDGKIVINNVLLGNYEVIETTNPHYGYRFEGPNNIIVDKADNVTPNMIKNEQVYVKLSGYVFLDVQSAKQSLRNNLYRNDTMDDEDQLLSNVQVRLVDRRTGNTVTNDSGTVCATTTKEIKLGDNILRYYQFVDIKIDELSNYYIEFTYDGLTYQNVTPTLTANNGSKSAEDATERDNFNKDFSTIEGNGVIENEKSKGVALNESGQVEKDLLYNFDKQNSISTLINNNLPTGQYPITANTDSAGYSIKGDFQDGDEEIPYINLGLYEREKPDLSLVKDMYNVRLSVNGYNHVYDYAMKTDHESGYDGEGFNVGVKWSSEYVDGKYTRAIYKADYEYKNANDSSKELQVYITYSIDVTNEASGIQTRVNKIADYFDSRYELVAVGKKEISKEIGLEQIKPDEGTITENVSYTELGEYNEKYSKVVINPNMTIDPGKTERVYVQFKLSREAVESILTDENTNNGGNLLKNIAEIDSYSSFQNGKVYAGIDKDSNPGNVVINGENVGEHDFDDTDISPALQLEVADARTLEGKVFLDSTSGELMTGQVRKGSGAYEEGESGIPGVKVTFTENTGSGKVYEATTNENGDFYIDNYIPGDYTLTYTWGDETYTVQKYKGTIYQSSRDQNDKEWYKKEVETRWTDAIDDYATREKIDNELLELTNSTKTTIDKMNSTTPTMGVGVEYDSVYTASVGDKYEYRIYNVDFGIVERARQDISLNKRVKTMKVTLANGRVLVDLTVDEDGKLSGTNSSVMYIPGSPNTDPKQGMIRLEMDSELMSGALLEIGYEFTATNNSELDYLDEDYYKYGIQKGEVVTITPKAIIDYLDTDWGFEKSKNENWEAISLDDPKIDLANSVRQSTEIKNRQILYTEALAIPLKPEEKSTTMLNVSKLLTSSQDIELDNETEIIEVEKTGGADLTTILGNYEPGTGPQVERDDDMAERVIITPNTGENLNFILPISIVVTAFVIVGAGIVFIKKKVLNK